mgnify:CR=1 FL=1
MSVSKQCRDLFRCLFQFATPSRLERQRIHDEWAGALDKTQFSELVNYVWDKKHNFLFVDRQSDTFHKNLNRLKLDTREPEKKKKPTKKKPKKKPKKLNRKKPKKKKLNRKKPKKKKLNQKKPKKKKPKKKLNQKKPKKKKLNQKKPKKKKPKKKRKKCLKLQLMEKNIILCVS